MNKLSGVVVVSGAASGIGRASASHFADCGATVVATDLNADGLATLPSRQIHAVAGDLTRDEDCVRVATAAAALGRVTGLLNCTGLEIHGTVVNMPEADWDRVIAANLKTIFLLSKHVIPHMIKGGGGSVVNMSAVQAIATSATSPPTQPPRAPLYRSLESWRSITARRTSASQPSVLALSKPRSPARWQRCTAPAIRKSSSTFGGRNMRSTVSVNRSRSRGLPPFSFPKAQASSRARIISSMVGFRPALARPARGL
jgi:NAD(P)-dependent dehydrogenase (short-subunit alcohol dehydrogenase family)